jgi:hypothetical protein
LLDQAAEKRRTYSGDRARNIAIPRFRVAPRRERDFEGSLEARKVIERAKGMSMDQKSLTEEQACYMNVMIDSGSDQNFPVLERGLFQIGIRVRDINLVINSHEHCDHIGANRYFMNPP